MTDLFSKLFKFGCYAVLIFGAMTVASFIMIWGGMAALFVALF